MRRCDLPSAERGITIVELMIGMTLSLVVVGAVTLLFFNNSRARQETENTSMQIENGRYAAQLLLEDLRLAGGYGEFNPTALSTPSSLPDPSATDAASLSAAMPLAVQGYDNGAGLPATLATLLADLRPGTDVLTIRRTSTCVAGSTGCNAVDPARYTYFQTTLCPNQLSSLPPAAQFLVGTDLGQFTSNNPSVVGAANPPAFLAKKDCLTAASLRSFYVRIYFVANNNTAGDGIPTLKVAELGAGSFSVAPLVAGIDQMQFEYGVDTNGDGAPDAYTASPANMTAWRQVTAVKVHLLARNTQASTGFTDDRTYILGAKTDGSDNTVGPFNDGYKRHVYTTVVRLNNVAGRME